tara:strand:- start:8224 stop:9861 length:1638 start_codon:yes stop_codon:yes gene_type:complete
MKKQSKIENEQNVMEISNLKILENSRKARISILIILCSIGFFIRYYFFPEDLPFLGDAIGYFWYANDMAILGNFPEGYTTKTVLTPPPNNGWPSFLSVFFSFINSNNFLDYVNLQRMLTTVISTLTIIPMYFLAKKFMQKSFAIICSAAFIFSPRLIENSLLGLTEPLFLLLGIVSLNLFLSDKKYWIILSFGIAGLFSIIRYEGLLILIPFTIVFFLRFHKNKKDILKFSLAIGIFLLIIFPMAMIRTETTGQDGLASHLTHGPKYYAGMINESENETEMLFHFISKGSYNLIQHLVYVSIPIFAIFIPYGIFEVLRRKEYKKWTVLIFGLTFLIPAFYAYSRGFQDPRYLFILYPIFCLAVGYSVRRINLKIKKPKIVFFSTMSFLIGCSVVFSVYTITDFEKEKEMYEITKDVYEFTERMNRDYQGLGYMKWSNELVLSEKFPIRQTEIYNDIGNSKIVIIGRGTENSFDNLAGYLSFAESEKMTHLVLDGNNLDTEFLKNIFKNENEYQFLKKIYDSKQMGYDKQVKIFEIDYNLFNKRNS